MLEHTEGRALTIGTLSLRSRVVVSPMVGITDAPFRTLSAELGAGLVTTEMVSSEALVRNIPAALDKVDIAKLPIPTAVQLMGATPETMAEAAQICVDRGADIIDVNLGCPVRKIVNQGAGACLARDIPKTAAVFEAIVAAVNVPVTAKIRTGWDESALNSPELAVALEKVGVAAITVHGRSRAQGYRGLARWDLIKMVKDRVSIPVLGNGDVTDGASLAERWNDSGLDGIAIARGVVGNFWFLRQAVEQVDRGKEIPMASFADRVQLARQHVRRLLEYYGEHKASKVGKKYLAWTIKGCAHASHLRSALQEATTGSEMENIFDDVLEAGEATSGWFQPTFISGEG
ncbi:MAG: tRNA dihydrouridine synthase DusB [Candidatus Dormibacteria bacterium]